MSQEFDADFWRERYRAPHAHAPVVNPQLTAEIGALTPGRALDAGCGEGADAIWLASRGWRVTAVDVAAEALRRAADHAAAAGRSVASRVNWVRADLAEWSPEPEGFELVYSAYVHVAGEPRRFLGGLAAAVAPGGTLLVLQHDHSDEHSGSGHGAHARVGPAEIAEVLDPGGWDITVSDVRAREVPRPDGSRITLQDAVLRARRHG